MFNFFQNIKAKATTFTSQISAQTGLENINEIKSKTATMNDSRHEQSELLYKEAIRYLEQFEETKNDDDAHRAAEKLFESLKYKRNGEVYFWLSYIFYIFDKDKTAFKYLRIAEELSPNYPKIRQFKTIISN